MMEMITLREKRSEEGKAIPRACRSGSPKAPVLPLPVSAATMTSPPPSTSGTASCCSHAKDKKGKVATGSGLSRQNSRSRAQQLERNGETWTGVGRNHPRSSTALISSGISPTSSNADIASYLPIASVSSPISVRLRPGVHRFRIIWKTRTAAAHPSDGASSTVEERAVTPKDKGMPLGCFGQGTSAQGKRNQDHHQASGYRRIPAGRALGSLNCLRQTIKSEEGDGDLPPAGRSDMHVMRRLTGKSVRSTRIGCRHGRTAGRKSRGRRGDLMRC